MATLSKAAVLVVGLQLFQNVTVKGPLVQLLAVLPLVSIVWGNVAAMRQDSLRRMIAYSSIAHAGYLFYAFLGDPSTRGDAVVFYLVTYAAGNLLAFAVLPPHDNDVTRDALGSLDGLFRHRPVAAALMAVAMFSLAGLPPFPGFTAKFLIFRTVVAAGFSTYAVLGLVGSFLGLFFYLRIIQRMFMTAGSLERHDERGLGLSRAAGVLCLTATVMLTIVPGWLLARI
jgi:NADH-quinone oxidoreductase subunit N